MLEAAPIDVAVLGLGRDGHVAFDEPPARMASGVHVVDLVETTREDAAIGFGGLERVPARALTIGLGTLYRARELILLVTGAVKAPALRAMLEEPVDPASPASLLRDHPRLTVICDQAAARLLTRRPEWSSDDVLVVLGHREPGISAEHRISAESRARLRHASGLARTSPIRAVVLTGYTSTGGLSEAEQMKTAWDEHQAPALLEVAGPRHRRERLAIAADPARARRGAPRDRHLVGVASARAVVLRSVPGLRLRGVVPAVVRARQLAADAGERAAPRAPRARPATGRDGGDAPTARGLNRARP